MNRKRWKILIFYAVFLWVFFSFGLIYQLAHPKDPPQPLLAIIIKSLMGEFHFVTTTITGIGITMGFFIWFYCAQPNDRRRRRYSE